VTVHPERGGGWTVRGPHLGVGNVHGKWFNKEGRGTRPPITASREKKNKISVWMGERPDSHSQKGKGRTVFIPLGRMGGVTLQEAARTGRETRVGEKEASENRRTFD